LAQVGDEHIVALVHRGYCSGKHFGLCFYIATGKAVFVA
jgi:hypothetical protein